MKIQKVNSPSFSGIRKVVSLIIPTKLKNLNAVSMNIHKGVCKTLKADTFVPSKQAKPLSLIKMTQFFNKDKLVGTHYEFTNGSYEGNRIFADGTKIKYSTTNLGNNFFNAGISVSNKQKGLINGHISFYCEKERPKVPTLKFIKKLQNQKNLKPVDITGLDL